MIHHNLTMVECLHLEALSEASQVKPSLLDEVEVEVLQEGLAGAIIL